MAGFKGQADYSIDDKGRVPVPAKMRRALSPDARDTFVVTRGFEQCVVLYPADRWEEVEASLKALNTFQSDARHVVRTMHRWADDVTLDSQGRIALPKALVEFANLTHGRARILGVGEEIEIWDPDTHDAYEDGQESPYEVVAEQVLGGKP
jgi:MraZ protein